MAATSHLENDMSIYVIDLFLSCNTCQKPGVSWVCPGGDRVGDAGRGRQHQAPVPHPLQRLEQEVRHTTCHHQTSIMHVQMGRVGAGRPHAGAHRGKHADVRGGCQGEVRCVHACVAWLMRHRERLAEEEKRAAAAKAQALARTARAKEPALASDGARQLHQAPSSSHGMQTSSRPNGQR